MIYFITVNYYSVELIESLINSIKKTATIPYKMIVVNNSVDDPLIHTLAKSKILLLNAEKNLGYGLACNIGLNWVYACDPNALVWIINPDTILLEDSLEKAQKFLETHAELSIVGTLVYDSTGEIWFAGGRFNPQLGAIFSDQILSVPLKEPYIICDWVTGCSLIINLKNFPSCPQFSPDYFLYYEDFDFCQRYQKQGHLIGVTHQVAIIHQVSSITKRSLYQKSKQSTYSYLLTLKKYTGQFVLLVRLMQIVVHAILLGIVQPSRASGVLHGIFSYLRRNR